MGVTFGVQNLDTLSLLLAVEQVSFVDSLFLQGYVPKGLS